MRKMPPSQRKVYQFIQTYIQEHGYSPTVRDICRGTGISSTSHVSYCLDRLEERGLIQRERGKARSIRLIKQSERDSGPTLSVPFLGYIVASAPIHTYPLSGDETVEVNRAMLDGNTDDLFALRVQGNSMIDALIHDGDLIILRRRERVENGEMAAVWVEGNADYNGMTLKRVFYESDGRVRLQPEHPEMEPIYVPAEAVHVQGKVVMVIRQLE